MVAQSLASSRTGQVLRSSMHNTTHTSSMYKKQYSNAGQMTDKSKYLARHAMPMRSASRMLARSRVFLLKFTFV